MKILAYIAICTRFKKLYFVYVPYIYICFLLSFVFTERGISSIRVVILIELLYFARTYSLNVENGNRIVRIIILFG